MEFVDEYYTQIFGKEIKLNYRIISSKNLSRQPIFYVQQKNHFPCDFVCKQNYTTYLPTRCERHAFQIDDTLQKKIVLMRNSKRNFDFIFKSKLHSSNCSLYTVNCYENTGKGRSNKLLTNKKHINFQIFFEFLTNIARKCFIQMTTIP